MKIILMTLFHTETLDHGSESSCLTGPVAKVTVGTNGLSLLILSFFTKKAVLGCHNMTGWVL
jgi:hypothetical protein